MWYMVLHYLEVNTHVTTTHVKKNPVLSTPQSIPHLLPITASLKDTLLSVFLSLADTFLQHSGDINLSSLDFIFLLSRQLSFCCSFDHNIYFSSFWLC